jgi:hypothetical protein
MAYRLRGGLDQEGQRAMREASDSPENAMGKISVMRGFVVVCALAGWLVSYAYFGVWMQANDWAFFEGWRSAFTGSLFGTGLLMDLVFTTFAVVFLAWDDRHRLGAKWVAAIICAGALSVSMMLLLYIWRTWQLNKTAK